jgi:DNA-binding winged helix-turn-helix (wHTH) protein
MQDRCESCLAPCTAKQGQVAGWWGCEVKISFMRPTPTVELATGDRVEVSGQGARILRALHFEPHGVSTRRLQHELSRNGKPVAPSTVAAEIARLRAKLGDQESKQLIKTLPLEDEQGYRLDRVDLEVDADLFEQAVKQFAYSHADFSRVPAGDGVAADEAKQALDLMVVNPGRHESTIEAVSSAYSRFEMHQRNLELAVAFRYTRRYLDEGLPGDATDAVAVLKRLALRSGDEEVWILLIRIEGSLPNRSQALSGLKQILANELGPKPPVRVAEALRGVQGKQSEWLLTPAPSTGVVVDPSESFPKRPLTAEERGNLAEVAVKLGISSNAALRLKDSGVQPSESIDKTVSRLWFAGILGGKYVLDKSVLAKFERLLDRLDSGEDAQDVVGTPVRLLILDPESKSFETLRRLGTIREGDIQSIPVLKSLVKQHPSFAVHLYDSPPMFRMIIIDDSIVTVGPYLNLTSEFLPENGWELPHLVLTPAAQYPLAKSFETLFRDLWRRSRSIEKLQWPLSRRENR